MDSLAFLIEGSNVCTALTVFNSQLIVAANEFYCNNK